MQLVKSGKLNSILLFFIPFHCTPTLRTTNHFYSELKEQLIFTVTPRSEVPYSNVFSQIQGKRQLHNSVTVQASSSRRGSKPSILIHQINVSKKSQWNTTFIWSSLSKVVGRGLQRSWQNLSLLFFWSKRPWKVHNQYALSTWKSSAPSQSR